MSFIDWKDLFDDIFEGYPDKWTLNWVHRNNTSQYQKLQNKREMERTGYARYIILFFILPAFSFLIFVDFIVQNVRIIGPQLKLWYYYIFLLLINRLEKLH